MYGDSDGSKDAGAGAGAPPPSDQPFPNRELTLSSYLCDKPTLASAAAAENAASAAASAAAGPSSPPNPAADAAAEAAKLCVERDFLHLSAPKRGGDPPGPGDDSSVAGGKKPRLDSLQLSLSLASDGQPSSHPHLPSAAPDGDLRAAASAGAAAPAPRRTYSATTGRTRSINSDDMSYSYSMFSHNPSCSLTHNSTDMYAAGEGTNGSVHSRFNFRPVGDGSVAFATPPANPGSSSFFPTELPAKLAAAAAAAAATTFDGGRGQPSHPDRILREIVTDSVPAMAHALQDLPSDTLDAVRDAARALVDAPERRDELAGLQRRLDRRSDLTADALARANRTQLEVLTAVRTGTAAFAAGKGRVPSAELVEMFLMTRCRNPSCKSALPVDDCECKVCAAKKGFCSACMCPVCHKFDCAANTCSWVGCDVCGHWCHAVCGLERNLIRPGPTLKGPIGTTEMQFQCLGCSHASEMFGFVKEVFNSCAENWNAETLVKELDFVRNIFAASDDFEGKGLHSKAEEVLNMLGKKVISLLDATNIMLQFFKYGVTDCSVTGNKSKGILAAAQASQSTIPLLSPTMTAPKSFNFNANNSILDTHIDALKGSPKPLSIEPRYGNSSKPLTIEPRYGTSSKPLTIEPHYGSSSKPISIEPHFAASPKPLSIESHFAASPKPLSVEPHFSSTSKDDDASTLETIVKCKEAEAKLFQKLADDARKEVDNYRQMVRSRTQKLEEEYATKLAKLCFQETEEKRRKKMEELKTLENSHYDYHKMKLRMQTEIQGLLERMEATKKMWV
ncbi:protein TITANIA-like isoform X1 [Lolium rigidum]|uniref:protein TITANIA-like isoform X1 n=1 Tax=Lolium rigidum TaxID=89674 RepID=UPI001F5D1E96|nr:protein TITANIA-like isoform X1 [Lolium rigidum]